MEDAHRGRSRPDRGVAISDMSRDNIPTVVCMVQEFAAYQGAEAPADLVEVGLRHAISSAWPVVGCLATAGGQPAGYILGYRTFSTYAGLPRLFVEDIFVRAGFRGIGLGGRLMAEFAARHLPPRNAGLQWRVQRRNDGGIHFYRSLGADICADHLNCILSGNPLGALVGRSAESCAPTSQAAPAA